MANVSKTTAARSKTSPIHATPHVQTDFTAGLRLRIGNAKRNIRLFLVTEKAGRHQWNQTLQMVPLLTLRQIQNTLIKTEHACPKHSRKAPNFSVVALNSLVESLSRYRDSIFSSLKLDLEI